MHGFSLPAIWYLEILLVISDLLQVKQNFTISFEMPVPSQAHYGFHSFPVVD
jgi:hypothetical protein